MKQYKTTIVDGYVLIVDDSDIKEGDFTYHHVKGIYNAVIDGAYTNQKKIIAHLPLNNSLVLQGVPILPPIKQPKLPVAFNCQMEIDCEENNDGCYLDSCGHNCGCEFKPKTISTSNGEQWIGEWVY